MRESLLLEYHRTEGEMMRTVEIRDGYVIAREGEQGSPVLCPFGAGGLFCCESCAAYRVEVHLDGSSGKTVDTNFVTCMAMGDRGAAIGRIQNG